MTYLLDHPVGKIPHSMCKYGRLTPTFEHTASDMYVFPLFTYILANLILEYAEFQDHCSFNTKSEILVFTILNQGEIFGCVHSC